jgi:hypothetical protein
VPETATQTGPTIQRLPRTHSEYMRWCCVSVAIFSKCNIPRSQFPSSSAHPDLYKRRIPSEHLQLPKYLLATVLLIFREHIHSAANNKAAEKETVFGSLAWDCDTSPNAPVEPEQLYRIDNLHIYMHSSSHPDCTYYLVIHYT